MQHTLVELRYDCRMKSSTAKLWFFYLEPDGFGGFLNCAFENGESSKVLQKELYGIITICFENVSLR